MTKKELRIIFLGTPDFALTSLKLLVEENWNVVGVVTIPDKQKGRGLQITSSPIKNFALEKGIEVMQPANLKDQDFQSHLKSLNAHLQIVVAFRMLPETVWNMPPMGTMNLHASLLPDYRGAAPINWVLINGEKETGVTTFLLKHEIDTGNILLQEKIRIEEGDDAGTLHDRLKEVGAQLVIKSIEGLLSKSIIPTPQKLTGKERQAPKIIKETCIIDWNTNAEDIKNLIRGLCPYPGARGRINNINYKIYKAIISSGSGFGKTGDVKTDNKSFIEVQTGNGIISILELQKEGKNRMSVKDFLIGNSI